jgi:RNA polymerase sigma factor (sigma-70 family)
LFTCILHLNSSRWSIKNTFDQFRQSEDRLCAARQSEIAQPILNPVFRLELMEQSDKQLLLACRRGDESAWESLVNRYQRLVYAIPRRAGLDEDQAAEVFQDVFAILVEKLDEIEQPERLQAWLVTTAKRKTWRVVLKGKNAAVSMEDNVLENEIASLSDQSSLPDEVLLKLEEQHQIRTAVAALDERCRNLLTLLFYDDEPPSYAEIAARIGASEGSIGPTRARCLEKLLRLLKN